MSRAPSTFRESDVKRLVRAAEARGQQAGPSKWREWCHQDQTLGR